MNTDNMSIAGETIDYGPCAFMDAYHPATVFSSIDHYGRYAYGNQPRIAQWNLTRFAETLLPLLAEDAGAAVGWLRRRSPPFAPRFDEAFATGLRRKLGLLTPQPGDALLAKDLLDRMAANSADFTLTFRRLCDAAESAGFDDRVRILFADPAAFDEWGGRWRKRLVGGRRRSSRAPRRYAPGQSRVHPPQSSGGGSDLSGPGPYGLRPFETLITVLANPYDDQPGFARYAEPPRPDQVVHQTFCGT